MNKIKRKKPGNKRLVALVLSGMMALATGFQTKSFVDAYQLRTSVGAEIIEGYKWCGGELGDISDYPDELDFEQRTKFMDSCITPERLDNYVGLFEGAEIEPEKWVDLAPTLSDSYLDLDKYLDDFVDSNIPKEQWVPLVDALERSSNLVEDWKNTSGEERKQYADSILYVYNKIQTSRQVGGNRIQFNDILPYEVFVLVGEIEGKKDTDTLDGILKHGVGISLEKFEEIADYYDGRFGEKGVLTTDKLLLFKGEVPNELAKKYVSHFSAEEVVSLKKKGIMPEKANKYRDGISVDRIYHYEIARKNDCRSCTPSRVNSFSDDFSEKMVVELIQEGYNGRVVSQYPTQLNSRTLKEVAKSPWKYPSDKVTDLAESGCSFIGDEVIITRGRYRNKDEPRYGRYPSTIRNRELDMIGRYLKLGAPGEACNGYDHFNEWTSAWLYSKGVTPDEANEYPSRFRDSDDLIKLDRAGIDGPEATEYLSSTKSADHMIKLKRAGISPEDANEFPYWVRSDEMVVFKKNRVPTSFVLEKTKQCGDALTSAPFRDDSVEIITNLYYGRGTLIDCDSDTPFND
jgi:hypothetical protein